MAKYLRLGDLLLSVGAITQEQLDDALKFQKTTGHRLGQALIEGKFITERQLIEALQMQLGVEYIDLASARIPTEMAKLVPRSIARRHGVVPVKLVRDELYLAMSDPLNFIAIEEVRAATQKRIVPMITTREAAERAVAALYGGESAARAIEDYNSAKSEEDKNSTMVSAITAVTLGEDDLSSAPTIRLVNTILEQAVVEKASDIHIEPLEDGMVVRLRVDGVLRPVLDIPQDLKESVVSRIKVLGNMDVSQRRAPQDGRANVRLRQSDVDLRISTLPTVHGEKVTIRLLTKNAGLLSTAGIGLVGSNLQKFDDLIHKNSNGVILIVGPTGSGKSSTMSTIVRTLNRDEVNIVTLEDPVEYEVPGVNQVQINDKVGMTFAGGLRSILRQDPDIISVGEIRDGETAEIAMRAAITGHLVFSTLHTNSAPSTIDRLIDMGAEPFMIGEALKGVISQRLVRRICPNCRTEYVPTEEEQEDLGIPKEEFGSHKFFRGAGCSECYQTGFKGRTAVFEIMVVTAAVRRAIRVKEDRDLALDKALEQSGFESMLQDCRRLVFEGITTCEEALKAVQRTDV